MKNTGRRITCEGKRSFLDAPLVVEVRDARPLVCRSHGCIDVVFDAGFARQRRKTFALRLFPLDACLRRVLRAEDALRAGQRTAQRNLVVEIALDDVDAMVKTFSGELISRGIRLSAVSPGPIEIADCRFVQRDQYPWWVTKAALAKRFATVRPSR
jgi:hypothetical protein